MDSRLNKQIEPVCRFGPGGDFISVWPSEPQRFSLASKNIPFRKEILEYTAGTTRANGPAYPAPATVIKGDSLFPDEPMLFTDDWRVGLRAGHKPKHHIRAYRRAVKKRPALVLAGQGSLFDANFKSAKTA